MHKNNSLFTGCSPHASANARATLCLHSGPGPKDLVGDGVAFTEEQMEAGGAAVWVQDSHACPGSQDSPVVLILGVTWRGGSPVVSFLLEPVKRWANAQLL